jgi:hypothetical protein
VPYHPAVAPGVPGECCITRTLVWAVQHPPAKPASSRGWSRWRGSRVAVGCRRLGLAAVAGGSRSGGAGGAGGVHGRGKAVGLGVPLLGGVALPTLFAGQRRTAQNRSAAAHRLGRDFPVRGTSLEITPAAPEPLEPRPSAVHAVGRRRGSGSGPATTPQPPPLSRHRDRPLDEAGFAESWPDSGAVPSVHTHTEGASGARIAWAGLDAFIRM